MGESCSFRTWLSFSAHVMPDVRRVTAHVTNAAHSLVYLRKGSFQGRWICRGKEYAVDDEAGSVRFHPANGEDHVLSGAVGRGGLQSTTLMIPPEDLRLMAVADGVKQLPDLRPIIWPNDAMLRTWLDVLVGPGDADTADEDREEAARSLVLRVAELLGATVPAWRSDRSAFTSRTLDHLVGYIDAHLRAGTSAGDMALNVGLSPSHFARKFHRSVGMSLQRFVMQRRIQASFAALKDPSKPLAHVALELGFSSQSHFTRMFSERTGMTPAKYRKQFRPTVG